MGPGKNISLYKEENFLMNQSLPTILNSILMDYFLKKKKKTFSIWKSLKFVVWERVNNSEKVFDHNMETEEIAKQHFLLFPQCFLPV